MSLLIVALMLQVNVALPSGKRNSLSIAESSKVGDLKRLAQKSFEQGFLRLVTAEGHALADPNQFLQAGRAEGGRSPDSHCATSKDGGNRRSFCYLVPWR